MVPVALPRFARALTEAKRVGVDTQVLIYHLEGIPPYAELTTHLLAEAAAGKVQLVVSAITVSELLVKPFRAGLATAWIEAALSALPGLTLGTIAWDTARRGAELRARTGLPLPDALILASMIEEGAQAALTNDLKWRTRPLPCRILVLDDYL